MTGTARIRWHDEPPGTSLACKGYVGTIGAPVFKIYRPSDTHRNWLGIFQLTASDDRYFHGDTSDEAKDGAEQWLVRFVSYLGASFAEDATAIRWQALKDDLTTRIEQDLAQHQRARDAGEHAAAASYGGMVSENHSTLARMRELEAGQ